MRVEELEPRTLLSGLGTTSPVPLLEVEPNDTLDRAQNLGELSSAAQTVVVGNVGNGPAGAADVDWYQFTLAHAARIGLGTTTPVGGNPLVSVLGLYNSDPWTFPDPDNATGHRLLVQSAGAAVDATLAPGTYYVAVSGAGNRYFNPYLADSGLPGSNGDYQLTLTAADLPEANPGDGPIVLDASPGGGTVLDRSPLVVRVDLDSALDPSTVDPSATAQLLFSATGDFSNASTVPLSWYNFSSSANELQLAPATPLGPGYYQIFLAGDSSSGSPVLADPNGVPLGADALHPKGQDYRFSFQVSGIEGGTQADDTAATAHQLGDLTGSSQVQVSGAIGDDPLLAKPAADVDLYHFQISGPGNYAFVAEAFAGRIGSRLNPGVSLFRRDSGDGQLHFVDGNDDTLNDVPSTNGMLPLYDDALLYAGLTAGDYYLAVSGGGNTPERALGDLPGVNGIFDPNIAHSGSNGATVGNYVLNLIVQADNEPPQVLAVTPQQGSKLDAPPAQFTVQFSEPVNLRQLAYLAYQQGSQNPLTPIWVEAADGTRYSARLEAYDSTTNRASFLMLDGMPNGLYELHLSGSLGLTDFAGNALAGNDPTGDFVTSFTVAGPGRGTDGNPLLWFDQESNDDPQHPQELGALFPHELQTGVTVVRDFTLDPADTPADSADCYQLQVLQNRTYVFLLDGKGLPPGVGLTLFDAAGNLVPVTYGNDDTSFQAQFDAGTYAISVNGWPADQAGSVAYQLHIGLGESGDNPPPLAVGAPPASITNLGSAASLAGAPSAAETALIGDAPPRPLSLPRADQRSLPSPAPIVAVAATLAPSGSNDPVVSFAGLVSSAERTLLFPRDSLMPWYPHASDAPGGTLPASLQSSLRAGPVGGVEDSRVGTPPRPDHGNVQTPSVLWAADVLAARAQSPGGTVPPSRTNAANAIGTPELPWTRARGVQVRSLYVDSNLDEFLPTAEGGRSGQGDETTRRLDGGDATDDRPSRVGARVSVAVTLVTAAAVLVLRCKEITSTRRTPLAGRAGEGEQA